MIKGIKQQIEESGNVSTHCTLTVEKLREYLEALGVQEPHPKPTKEETDEMTKEMQRYFNG